MRGARGRPLLAAESGRPAIHAAWPHDHHSEPGRHDGLWLELAVAAQTERPGVWLLLLDLSQRERATQLGRHSRMHADRVQEVGTGSRIHLRGPDEDPLGESRVLFQTGGLVLRTKDRDWPTSVSKVAINTKRAGRVIFPGPTFAYRLDSLPALT